MVTNPPIQQQPIDQSGFFDRVWAMWFSSIKTCLDDLESQGAGQDGIMDGGRRASGVALFDGGRRV